MPIQPIPAQTVVAKPPRSSFFITLTVKEAAEAVIRSALTECSGLARSVAFRCPEAELITEVGIGSDLWDRMLAAPKPKGLHPFRELHGDKHTAPATAGDLFLHIRSERTDMCFEMSRMIIDFLDDSVEVMDEVHAFRYFDDRDLLGFVDGSENPEGHKAYDAALIGDEDPDYRDGSYVIVQKYIHDLPSWQAISVEAQERVIGRTKLANLELSDDAKPQNSHVALNDISDEDGNDLDILRFNQAFGDFSTGQHGTYFIGYAKDPAVTEKMLENMFIGNPEGNHDRILDFSTALTGALFFTPSAELLDRIDGLGKAQASKA
jgi:putative iron-dependent peroxidase